MESGVGMWVREVERMVKVVWVEGGIVRVDGGMERAAISNWMTDLRRNGFIVGIQGVRKRLVAASS